MTQLFNRYSDSFFKVILFFVALATLGMLVGWTVLKWAPWQTEVGVPVDQPIPFSHKHHVAGLGIDCRYCHTSVTQSASAGLPPTHTCMTCHSQIWQGASMLAPLRQSYSEEKPLQWNRVYRLPKYVYFNHSIHVNKGVGCTTCHGQIDQMPLTWKTQPFYMKDCLECHRNPEKYLRPEGEIFNVHWTPPLNQLNVGSELVKKYHIPTQRLTDCNTCHR